MNNTEFELLKELNTSMRILSSNLSRNTAMMESATERIKVLEEKTEKNTRYRNISTGVVSVIMAGSGLVAFVKMIIPLT